jgi:hypothetical protein
VAEEGRGENEVIQQLNPTANAAANPPANAATNAAGAQPNVAANPRQNSGAQPSSAQANDARGSQRRRVRDEVEISRHANYDRDHGVPDPLDANNPVQATNLR